jgi:hypothetical protein
MDSLLKRVPSFVGQRARSQETLEDTLSDAIPFQASPRSQLLIFKLGYQTRVSL